MTEIDKNNKAKNKDGLKLPDEFYQDLGLEPQGLPDLSEAWSDIESREAAARAQSPEEPASVKVDSPKAKRHKSEPEAQATPPLKPEKNSQEASKAPSLRDKFRALRKYFIISLVLNLLLLAALVVVSVFYYKEVKQGARLEPQKTPSAVSSLNKDETATSGAEEMVSDSETKKAAGSSQTEAGTKDKTKTEETDKVKKPASSAATKATESKSKKAESNKAKESSEAKATKETTAAETSKAKETTEPKSSSAQQTTEAEASSAQETSEAETSKTIESTTPPASKESTAGSQEATSKPSKAPSETSSKETKASQATSPLDKALAKAKKLSQEELKEKALNLNYYEMAADPDQHLNDLVVAGGKILNIYDDGILIVEDYLPGGLTYYYCPWFIRFDKAKDLGLSVGEVVNFYGIYSEMGTYKEESTEQALIVEGVDFVAVGW